MKTKKYCRLCRNVVTLDVVCDVSTAYCTDSPNSRIERSVSVA